MTNESKVDRTTILVDSSTPMPYCPVMTGTTAAEGRVITKADLLHERRYDNSHTMAKVALRKCEPCDADAENQPVSEQGGK